MIGRSQDSCAATASSSCPASRKLVMFKLDFVVEATLLRSCRQESFWGDRPSKGVEETKALDSLFIFAHYTHLYPKKQGTTLKHTFRHVLKAPAFSANNF
jgi:hypothetical protein